MGIHVEVIKLIIKEDKNFVYYTYQFSIPGEEYRSSNGKIRYRLKVVNGKLKIDKKNGDVHTVELAESDTGAYAKCASSVLIRYWLKGKYPEKAYWDS